VVASPAAKRFAALALAVEAVGKPELQNRLHWFLRRFHDAQWKRVEIQQRISIVHETPASGDVAVANDHVPAGVLWPRSRVPCPRR